MTTPTHHASVVALRHMGAWRGVLIRGRSGSGKSDLALRLMDQGARLIADDRVHLWASNGCLYARAPATISGMIEVRGLGIVATSPLDMCRIRLIVDLIDTAPERMPEAEFTSLADIQLPRLEINPRPMSASTVVARAIEAL